MKKLVLDPAGCLKVKFYIKKLNVLKTQKATFAKNNIYIPTIVLFPI